MSDLIGLCEELEGGLISLKEKLEKNRKDKDSKSKSEVSARIAQLRVLEQAKGDSSCGYYCIYYAWVFKNILHAMFNNDSNDKKLRELMIDLCDNNKYNACKNKVIEYLINVCKNDKKNENNCYPWEIKHIETGVLERVYLQYIQSKQNTIKQNESIAYELGIALNQQMLNMLDFNVTCLQTNQLPLQILIDVESFLTNCIHFITQNRNDNNDKENNNENKSKVILIGSTIHYVLLCVYPNIQKKSIDILYCDPQNNDILNKNNKQINIEIIQQMTFQAWINLGWHKNDMVCPFLFFLFFFCVFVPVLIVFVFVSL